MLNVQKNALFVLDLIVMVLWNAVSAKKAIFLAKKNAWHARKDAGCAKITLIVTNV